MGTGITLYLEVKKDGAWQHVSKPSVGQSYDMFGILADVRNYVNAKPISEPKGLPDDLSATVKQAAELYGEWDGFSFSYLTQKEIADYDWNQVCHDSRLNTVNKKTGEIISKASYTNPDCLSADFELKQIDVTAKSVLEGSSYEVLFNDMSKLAQEYGSENVRIVFWFS
jgi:hypothetical protein